MENTAFDQDQSIIDQAMGQLDDASYESYGEVTSDNPRFAGDENLYVRFYHGSRMNRGASEKEGRPIFVEIPYIQIMVPGDRSNTIDRPVTNQDKRRFSAMWRKFSANEAQTQVGTPLSAWPAITRSQVEELKHFKITTVEQLASMPDNVSQRFMGINSLKKKAQDFLEAAKGMALTNEMRSEMERKDAQIAALTEAVQDLANIVQELKNSKAMAVKDKADETVEAALSALAPEVEPVPEINERVRVEDEDDR